MPKKYRSTTGRVKPSMKGIRKRIEVPQSAERPVVISRGNVVKWSSIQKDTWWMVLHRRGIHRIKIGQDPLEARAAQYVKGTLPERILYQALVVQLKQVDGIDFDFQSSLEGGRIDLGGIVADFLFPLMMFVIQVQGPTHNEFLRAKKDIEQAQTLAEFGYRVYEITEDEVYNEFILENKLRQIFNLGNPGGGGGSAWGPHEDPQDELVENLFQMATQTLHKLEGLHGLPR